MDNEERMNMKKQLLIQLIESIDSPMFADYVYAFLKRIMERGN